MKNIFYKILLIFLLLFSFNFINASEINETYKEYEKLSEEEKSKIDFIPNEYVNYYEINQNILLNQKSRSIYSLYSLIPSTYDLRNVNNERLIPEMKNQSSLGLCWAFSTNNIIESYQLKNDKEYNLSENQPGYVAKYLGDSSSFGSANSLGNAIKYWFYGFSPISEDVFGSYFTTYQEKSYKDYLDNNNILFDITDVIVYPMLRMSYIKENYTATNIQNIVLDYNTMIKEHIMNYGAIATGIYWDFYDSNTNMIYNDGSLTYEDYGSSGHAITIIGWDDNYEGVDINGTTLNGAWLAMNSWGDSIEYFYISYYDANVTESFVGIKEIQEKNWNNVYLNYEVYTSSSNKVIYEFSKENKQETIDSLKMFYLYDDDNINITISDGVNTYETITDTSVTYGIKTFKFDDISIDSEKIYVTVETTTPSIYYSLALYTTDEETDKSLSIIDKNTTTIEDIEINYDVYTKNIETGTNLTINIYDDQNKLINSLFQISSQIVVNDYSNINLILLSDLDYTEYIKLEVSADSTSDTIILYPEKKGTQEDPIIIRTPYEMIKLSKENTYFKLGNDIDMQYDTTALYGDFNSDATGWTPIEFKGYLDGNGYEIANLNTKQGSLFETMTDSSIENIKLNNFIISDESSSSSYSGTIAKTMNDGTISNVYINNLKINATKTSSSGVVGTINGGTISNVHIKDSTVDSEYYSGLVSSNISNSTNETNIQNIFINNSKNTGNVYGLLIGKINYTGEESSLNNTSIKHNIVNNDDDNLPLIGTTYARITNNSEVLLDYDIYENYVTLENNYIKNNEEILNKKTFSDFDLTNIWSFNTTSGAYLNLFKDEFITNLISFETYSLQSDIISKIDAYTTVEIFENDIIDKDKLSYKIYSSNNEELININYLTTGSYISVENEDTIQKYYIAVRGDTNGDGELSVFDIVKINNHIIDENKKLEGIYNIAADYNQDGELSIFDIVKINNEIIGGEN